MLTRLFAIPWSSRVSEFWLLRQFNRRFEDATRGYGGFLMVLRYRLLVVAITFIVLASGSLLMVGQIPQEILPASTQDKLTFCPVFSRYPSETTNGE